MSTPPVVSGAPLPPGLVGLSLSYALSLTGLLSGLVSSFTQTEAMLVSVERLEEYSCDLPQEPQGQLSQVGLHLAPGLGAGTPKDLPTAPVSSRVPFLSLLAIVLSSSNVPM